jgi:hypothetical protein
MRQILHLLLVDRLRHAVIAATYGGRWLLPVLISEERARPGPLIARWLAESGMSGEVAGHWLGRTTEASDDLDWLVAVDATCDCTRDAPWLPLEELRTRVSVLEYQTWAVGKALWKSPLPSVPGPFGNLTWLNDVKAWICRIEHEPHLKHVVGYRAAAHEVVLQAATTRRRIYFKGLEPDRAVEARLTQTMFRLAAASFAQTIAIEERGDGCTWWLTAECPGRHATDGEHVSRALASLQQQVIASPDVRASLPSIDLEAAAAWSTEVLRESGCESHIRRAFACVRSADVPRSWIPLDLDPSNVLVDDKGNVRFIDLDDSFIGPAPLAIAVCGRRFRARSLYRSYEQAWVPRLRTVDWHSHEVVAIVLEAWLGSIRLARNTERGEVYGLLERAAARVRARLIGAIARAARTEGQPCRTQPAGF